MKRKTSKMSLILLIFRCTSEYIISQERSLVNGIFKLASIIFYAIKKKEKKNYKRKEGCQHSL